MVQAGVEGGKAVAQVAAGTAVGGPWGAILSALWALRHTLFKILVFLCLLLLLFIVMIVSLPSILMNAVFGLDGTAVDMENPVTLQESYNEMAGAVSDVVDQGYNRALEKVEQIIQDGGYDYDLSMEALINYAQSSAGYDVSYILAAYSASLQQQGTSEADMVAKLEAVMDDMFPVTYEEKQQERLLPVLPDTMPSICDPFKPLLDKICTIQIHSPNLATFILSTDGYQKVIVTSISADNIQIRDKNSVVILNKRDIVGIVES